jgi:soluble lytic murein transglycosylase
MQKRSENIRIRRPCCGTSWAPLKSNGRLNVGVALLLFVCSAAFVPSSSLARTSAGRVRTSRSSAAETRLETLCRALKDEKTAGSAYRKLSDLASSKSSGITGARAALALGYFDYGKGNYAQAAKWLVRAQGDRLLGDYVLYWKAETDLALGHNADSLAEFQQFRVRFPDSVMTEQALQSLGNAGLALNQPATVIAALDAYPRTADRPALLLLRGEAHEQAGQPVQAAGDYTNIYVRYPASDQARDAGQKLDFLRSSFGAQIPALSIESRMAHAGLLYEAKDWDDARNEYTKLLPEVSGAESERVNLRILECRLAQASGPADMEAMKISDPDVDAERYYVLASYYRDHQQEPQMVAAVESAASRALSSRWTALALFVAGNYYWLQLDRDHASSYYTRYLQQFPSDANSDTADWRVAWTAVMKRQPDDVELLEAHLRKFPASSYTSDALYWLGRLAEEDGKPSLARGYYSNLVDRYRQNYFATLGAERLRAMGPGTEEVSDVIATVPPVPPIPKLDGAIPAAAMERKERADALRSIAFDSSAELELQDAYAATGEPRLLLEAAQAAVAAGHCGVAILAIRQILPRLDSEPFEEVPRDAWLAAYALPFEHSIRRWSAHQGLDPMLVAGLIHQESAFEPQARSVSDAMGLMQLLASTARQVAKQSKFRYSHSKLFDPDYNVRLGTAYLSWLRGKFDTVEEAIAAYNTGPDHVTTWTTGQTYRETAEFVESIPITQTREYVEIVSRNADIYRRLYGAQHESRKTRTRSGN